MLEIGVQLRPSFRRTWLEPWERMAIASNRVNSVPVDCPDFQRKIGVKCPQGSWLQACLQAQRYCSSRPREEKGCAQVRENQAIFCLSQLSRLNDRPTRAIAGVDDPSLGLCGYQPGCKLLLINQGWLAVRDNFSQVLFPGSSLQKLYLFYLGADFRWFPQ